MNDECLFGYGDLTLPAVPHADYVQPLHYGQGVYRPSVEVLPLVQSVPNYKLPALFQTLLDEVGFELPEGIRIFLVASVGHPKPDGCCWGIGLVALDDRILRPHEYLAAAVAELAPLI